MYYIYDISKCTGEELSKQPEYSSCYKMWLIVK